MTGPADARKVDPDDADEDGTAQPPREGRPWGGLRGLDRTRNRNGRRTRWRRRLRRVLFVGLVAVVALTVASVAYNAATVPPARLAAPDGADVEVGGTRVHYRQWGAHGPVVVLVGGFLESTVSWEPMAARLGRDHRIYAVDLAGYGYSDYTGRYTLADETALVNGFLTAVGLGADPADRPALVGHSLGAAVVGSMALAHPDLVRGVVFADGDALPFGDPDRPSTGRDIGWLLRTPWAVSAYRLGTRTPAIYERAVRAQCGSRCEGYSARLADAWVRPMRQGDAERALARIGSEGMLALTATQVRAVRTPRAIVWGSEDATGGGSLDAARRNLAHPPERVIDGAGHLSMLALPTVFADDVAALTDDWR